MITFEAIALSAAITLFLGEYKETTAASYKPVLIDMQRYLGESRPLTDIHPRHMIEYKQAINRRAYKAATRGKYVKTVKVFFNWCVRIALLKESPANALKNERVPKAISRDKAMREDELKTLLQFTQFHPRVDALVRFLADTGCRRGGVAGLRVRDLQLALREATVTEKGNKSRQVAFGPRTVRALQRWLDLRPVDAGEYVFSRNGEKPTPYAISQLMRRACIAAGIRSLGTHSLRHRKGHQMADAGIAPSIAATALGHEGDVNTVLTFYYPHDWSSARRAIENLSLPDTLENDDLEI